MTENYTPKMNARDAVTKCRKVGEVTLELREITPMTAALMLMSNFEGNRKLKKTVVSTYAADMAEGRWEPTTNNVIQIGTDGRVYDGQHRLNAVVLANVTVPMYVNLHADPSEYMTYDNGKVRSEADVVNVANAASSQTLAKMVCAFEQGSATLYSVLRTCSMNGGRKSPTRAQVREIMITRDAEMQRHIRLGARMANAIGVGSKNTYAKALFIIDKLCDPSFVEEFVAEVGKDFPTDKTVAAVKMAIIKSTVAKKGLRGDLTADWLAATVIRAYESFVSGSGMTRFTLQAEWLKEYDKRLKEWREANRTEG